MIPRAGGKGRSFRGAAMYYLHDKRADGEAERVTDERVSWTHTHNLPTRDEWQAVYHMIDTAQNAHRLKEAAGGSRVGRKSNQHVYTYSLAWRDDAEPLSNEQMKDAALASLEFLGLSKNQALFVRHDDTAHQHVHVIVNRVCPETGKMAPLKCDWRTFSRWAQQYEMDHGGIQCEQRVENNKKRDELKAQGKSGFVKAKEDFTREEWLASKERRSKFYEQLKADRAQMDEQQKAQRIALYEAKEQMIAKSRATVKAAYKGEWNDLFTQQREEMEAFREKAKSFAGRAAYVLKNRQDVLGERAGLADLFKAMVHTPTAEKALEAAHQEARNALSQQQKNDNRDYYTVINSNYKQQRVDLVAQQQQVRSEFDVTADQKISELKAEYDALNERMADSANDRAEDRGRERSRGDDPTNKPT